MVDGYYLGEKVAVTTLLPGGWCMARSRKGRVWRHWADQVKREPWGDAPAVGEGSETLE